MLAQEGKINTSRVKRTEKGPFLIVSANWRLENAESPAAMLQENNPQTPHAWVYRVYVPGTYVLQIALRSWYECCRVPVVT